jgi:hypothetical protein
MSLTEIIGIVAAGAVALAAFFYWQNTSLNKQLGAAALADQINKQTVEAQQNASKSRAKIEQTTRSLSDDQLIELLR